jgi:hypothetical protein
MWEQSGVEVFTPRSEPQKKREEARSDCRREDGNDSSDDVRETVPKKNHCHSLCVPFGERRFGGGKKGREKSERGGVR